MIDLRSPALIGVIHLPALPGSPGHQLSMDEIGERALHDAEVLKGAGFDGVIVENFGDAPFSPKAVEPATVAAMAIIGSAVRQRTGLPVGLNVLRNDADAALGIAAAVGATFIRVNVHTGVAATDQGFIEGQAERTLRYRKRLGKRIAIFADVHVKHATPISEPDIERAARAIAYRGLADGLIVTGPATGEATDLSDLRRVREAVPDRRLFVGSGATRETAAELLTIADGIIVGTHIKVEQDPTRPVDPDRARAFAAAIGRGA